jgi:hypothetical protein
MNRSRLTLALMLGMLTTVGCQSLSGGKKWFGKEEKVEYATPNKVVAIWTDAVHNQTGMKPTRGLGGRIYFYDSHHKAVQVSGGLTVFVYDDTNPDNRNAQEPTRKVSFTPEQVAAFFTPSEFGPSYSVWVPWDEVGGERKHLSVIPVFTDHLGQMLAGDQARHVLPGTKPIETAIAKKDKDDVSTADYLANQQSSSIVAQASGSSDLNKQSVTSNTIKLPASMQQRLRSRHKSGAVIARRSNHHERAASWTRKQLSEPREAETVVEKPTTSSTSTLPRSGHSVLRPPQGQASQSAPQDHVPAPMQPGHEVPPSYLLGPR